MVEKSKWENRRESSTSAEYFLEKTKKTKKKKKRKGKKKGCCEKCCTKCGSCCCCKEKPCCRAGVCRCWYWLSNLFLLPLFMIVATFALGHSLYFAITYTLKTENDLLTHAIHWSVVGAALFILLIVQLTYVLILFEFKFKCSKVFFWILFTISLIFCLIALCSVAAFYGLGRHKQSDRATQPIPYGNARSLAAGDSGNSEEDVDDPQQQGGSRKGGKARTATDGNKKLGKNGSRQNKRQRIKRQNPQPDPYDPVPLSANARPPKRKARDNRSAFRKFHDSLDPIIFLAVYAAILFVILFLCLHMFLYFTCKNSGDKEIKEGCTEEGEKMGCPSSSETSSGSDTDSSSEDCEDDDINANRSSKSFHHFHDYDCKSLLSSNYHWSTLGQTKEEKMRSRIKVYRFGIV